MYSKRMPYLNLSLGIVLALGILISPARGDYCGDGMWANNCSDPSFVVSDHFGNPVRDVLFSINMDGSVNILIKCDESGSVQVSSPDNSDAGRIEILRDSPSSPSQMSISLLLDPDEPIDDVRDSIIQNRAHSSPATRIDVDLFGYITGDLMTGPSNYPAIDVMRIGTAETHTGIVIDGDVIGDINLEAEFTSVSVSNCQVEDLVVGGRLIGDVVAMDGFIEEITAADGIGDSSNSLASIISAAGSIERIYAGDFYGTLIAGSSTPADLGQVQIFGTDVGLGFSGSGDFEGEIYAAGFNEGYAIGGNAGIFVARDAIGTSSTDDWVFGELTDFTDDVPTIIIGRNLATNLTISVPDEGLAGEIIVNANADSMDPGDWDGAVEVDSTAISAPYYADTTDELGGGSVGLAPYRVHRADCYPEHQGAVFGYSLEIQGFEPVCVWQGIKPELAFYGPVDDMAVSGPPVTVQIKDGMSYTTVGWTPSVTVVDENRRLRVSGPVLGWDPGEYRVIAETTDIECRYVNGGPNPSATNAYFDFEIIDGCSLMLLQSFDCNSDQELCAEDMAAWAASPQDFNGDSSADATDLVILENAIDSWNSN